jgi:hypothetical protein
MLTGGSGRLETPVLTGLVSVLKAVDSPAVANSTVHAAKMVGILARVGIMRVRLGIIGLV